MNVEVMYTIYFMNKMERSETTLRNSAVRYSIVLRFAVQLSHDHLSGRFDRSGGIDFRSLIRNNSNFSCFIMLLIREYLQKSMSEIYSP